MVAKHYNLGQERHEFIQNALFMTENNQSNASAMVIALIGFGSLSIGDGFIKSLAGEWPGTAVAALRYSFGALGLGALLFIFEGKKGFILPKPKAQLARGFFIALATLCFFTSIFLMPLATATSIQFVNPMITAIISAIILREAASMKSWIATITAFIGVLIVLRPNFLELGWAAILPLVAAFGLSGMMIANRAVASTGSILLMQFIIAAIAAPILIMSAIIGHFSGFEPLIITLPNWHIIGICALVACTASFSHWFIYKATVKASAAAVAPMVYIQLLIAIIIGMIFYGDYPDALSLFGAGIIIASGLYLLKSDQIPNKGGYRK